MKRVTLTIEDNRGVETYTAEGETRWALGLVFRVTSAAVGAHPEEISALTEATRMISSLIQSAAEPPPVPSASESTP